MTTPAVGPTPASARPITSAPTATAGATRAVTARSLPGEPFDLGPAAGRSLGVVGVAADSRLPVQDLPGAGRRSLLTLGPLASNAAATGRSRLVAGAGSARATIWTEITVQGVTGWADSRHLAAPGRTSDVTDDVIDRLARRPTAATLSALGTTVAGAYVSSEPPSTVTVTGAPTSGDPAEITLDVVGLGDDAVAARRLRVIGSSSGGTVTLKRVTGTPFCSRGVAASGLCI